MDESVGMALFGLGGLSKSFQVPELPVGLLFAILVMSVVLRRLLSESSFLNVSRTFWQQGKHCAKSYRRWPLKIM